MLQNQGIQNKNISFLDKCLTYGIPIIYFLISVSFYLKTYDSAQIKITLLQIGGTIILSLWFIKLFEEGTFPFKGNLLLVVVPLLIYWALGPISYLHSAYQGTTHDELIRRIMYIGFGLIVYLEWNSQKKFDILVKWILAAGFISALYGIIQWLDINFFPSGQGMGLDPFIWRRAFGVRVFSTHGNPNFFGNFLVIITPIILSCLLKEFLQTEKLFKSLASFFLVVLPGVAIVFPNVGIVYLSSKYPFLFPMVIIILFIGIIFALLISFRWALFTVFFTMISFCILASGSKGAMLGYAVAVGIFAFLASFFFLKGRLKFLRIPIFLGMIVVGVVCAMLIVKLSFGRIDSIRFRVFTWLSTIEMIHANPIVGTGLGTFKTTYPAYRRPEIFHIEGKSNTETDHPENEFLEVWYDDGIIGFGLFIWVIVFFTYMGILGLNRFARISSIHTGKKGATFGIIEDPRAYYLLGFLTAFLAMLTHNLVDVSMRFVSSGIFLWLLAGLIGALLWHEPLPKDISESFVPKTTGNKEASLAGNNMLKSTLPFLKIALIVSICIVGFIVIRDFNTIQQPAPGQGQERFFSWFLPWICFLVCVIGALWILIRVSWNITRFKQVPVIPVMLFFVYIFWGYFVADANHNIGIFHSKKGKWEPALKHYKKVIKRNPNYIMAHYFMGNVYNDRWLPGDWKLALQKYDDVKKLAPNYVQVHHQTGMVYLKLFEQARRVQDKEKEKDYWQEAMHFFGLYNNLDPVFTKNYMHRGYLHVQVGNYAQAEENYRHALEEKPNDLEAIVNLGNIRYLQKDYQEAEEQYLGALKISSTYPGALKNLAILYGKIGRKNESIRLWNKLRQVSPNDPDVKRVFKAKEGS